ncbi:hypothetical protein AM493_11045 [Flavobacterium akiainvivens]|uniref:Uncharacterized protein n=1 Tax=Flavobacterium akiainvivens TaxID=1202724 RepID=A0A0M9VIC3_9FLAO|nr:hypothetical protein [Flavobacterium akiainvivens]KOS06510.1 hypothetical protein AM493_11045 [Flavobacterium akiainvivens]SFQ11764.1 hypothetical protein SAMN05444144_101151 [Flavobacterium akiainvivens]
MEDKDLDKYFKDRSDSFNETPGEGLWAKIEANIEPPAQGELKAGKWLLPGAGLVVVAGLVAAWLATRNTTEAPAPTQQQEITVIKDTITLQHTEVKDTLIAIHDTIARNLKMTGKQIVTTPEIKDNAIDSLTIDMPVKATVANNSEKKANNNKGEIITAHYLTANGQQDTTASGAGVIAMGYKVNESKDKIEIEITVEEKLTQAERSQLIKSTVQKNAQYVGRKIIIKAKGYRTYSHIITETDKLKYNFPQLGSQPGLRLEVDTDTLLNNIKRDTLPANTVKFEINPK